MKMLLGALGYESANEGYTGPNWSINVAKQAINIGLNKNLKGDFNGVKAVTREEACLYAFNTLKATMVEYTTQTIVVNNGNVSTDKTAKDLAWTGYNTPDGNIKKDGKVQFAEKYFDKLTAKYETDDFERPVTTWTNDKKEVGTYVRNDLLVEEYKGVEVTGADLYNLLGKSVVEDYDFNIAIDGITDSKVDSNVFNKTSINKNNKKAVGGTDTGVLTQVFQDTDNEEVYIAVINTYLAQAKKDYDTKKESADFTVYALKEVNGTNDKEYKKTLTDAEDKETITVSNDDVNVEGVKEDGFYLVTVAKHQVQTVEEAQTVSDTEISSFKLGSNVTAGSTKYEYAVTAEYDVDVLDNYSQSNMKDTTYNIILDTYGNLIGIEEVDAEDNYVFITGIDTSNSNLSKKNYDATAIFTDGTTKTITFKSDKGDIATFVSGKDYALINSWFTYTTDKDGVYTLTSVASKIDKANKVKVAQSHDTTSTTIDKKNIALEGGAGYDGVYGNNATIYLSAELKMIKTDSKKVDTVIISGVDNVTTGVKNASIDLWKDIAAVKAGNTDYKDAEYASSGAYILYKDNGYIIAAVVVGEDGESSKNLVYVNSDKLTSESYDKTADEWTWTREVIYNGEKTVLTEVGDSLSYIGVKAGQGNMQQYGWYQVKFNAKGEVIDAKLASAPGVLKINEYVDDIANLKTAIDDKDNVLYTQTFGTDKDTYDAEAPTMKGNTLYVQKTMTKGFYVDEDAKVVFIQKNDGKKTTEYATGADQVQDFIDDLNDKNGDTANGYFFTISAILENGVAKVVIINDGIDATYKPGEATKPSTSDKVRVTSVDTVNRVVYLNKADAANASDENNVKPVVNAALAEAGYEWTSWDTTGAPWKVTAVKTSASNTQTYTFSVEIEK